MAWVPTAIVLPVLAANPGTLDPRMNRRRAGHQIPG
jgi:hypothetical protein